MPKFKFHFLVLSPLKRILAIGWNISTDDIFLSVAKIIKERFLNSNEKTTDSNPKDGRGSTSTFSRRLASEAASFDFLIIKSTTHCKIQ